MNYLFLAVVWIGFTWTTSAQYLKLKDKPKLVYDNKNKEPLLFLNDSLVLKINQNKIFQVYKDEFSGNFEEYLPVNLENRNLFVHEGCGPVLEFKNDSLLRIDNSFLHKNQFSGSIFTYKNEIYFLGGYGLFTHKKILTKYINQEWNLVKTEDKELPCFTDCFTKVIGDHLFVYGGFNEDKINDKIYMLNLNTKKWKVYKSNLNLLFKQLSMRDSRCIIQHKYGIYYIIENKIYNVNFKTNTVAEYKNDYIKYTSNNFIINDIIYGLNEIYGNQKFKYEFYKYPLKKHISNKQDFKIIDNIYYEDNTTIYVWLFSIFILTTFTTLISYKKRFWFIYFIRKTPFVYSIKDKSLFYKGKYIYNLSNYDIIILTHQFQSKNNFFALSDLNDLFADKSINESVDVLVKRREKKLNSFIKTIGAISGLKNDEICCYKKNEIDQRIREIQILPNAITFIS